MCFFFFQAEDGIRDIGVTGVQTCALPIMAQMVTKQGGIQWVIEKIQTMVVGRKSAKFGIGMLVGLTDIAVANNTVAIIINGDRKSTRLNSSHANISYAVFCLKKKTH